jgi:hypothetical protein
MGFDQNPLRIADVAGIGLCSHVALYAFPPPYGTGSETVRDVCSDHGVNLVIPPAARGGQALSTVKVKRNALSHGHESFVEVGRNLTVADLVSEKDEIVLFMTSVLDNLENYAVAKSYRL